MYASVYTRIVSHGTRDGTSPKNGTVKNDDEQRIREKKEGRKKNRKIRSRTFGGRKLNTRIFVAQ